ncbi:MAG: hypothetical protein WCC04_15155 [Terriglobales bacterium]
MNRRRTFAVVFSLALAFGAFLPNARASEENQQMEFTFNQPLELPGVDLPAGTYWFVLADSPSNRNIMEVFSADWSTQYATLLTTSTIRQQSTDNPELQFAERHRGTPDALLKIFYPGMRTGHEFVYKEQVEARLSRDAKDDVVARPMNLSYVARPMNLSYVVPMTPHA